MLTFVKVRILEEIILIPALRSSNVTMHEGKRLLAAAVIFFTWVSKWKPSKNSWICRLATVVPYFQQGKHEKLLKQIERNLHGMIDSRQHLNHELWV